MGAVRCPPPRDKTPFGVVIDVCNRTGTIFDQRHVYVYRIAALYSVQAINIKMLFQTCCKEYLFRHILRFPWDRSIHVVEA